MGMDHGNVLVLRALLGHSVTMKELARIPRFMVVSLIILGISLVAGQLWLHRDASPSAIAGAKAALIKCGATPGAIETYWDVVRAHDRRYLHAISDWFDVEGTC
jgi:hypothetical protein